MVYVNTKLDQVSRNIILDEMIRREEKYMRLNTEFAITHPDRMVAITDKPNRTTPSHFPTASEIEEAHHTLRTMARSWSNDKSPAQRFQLPPTANWEYGFFSKAPAVPRAPMFEHPRSSCDVTTYASNYYRSFGASPYMRKDGPGSGRK